MLQVVEYVAQPASLAGRLGGSMGGLMMGGLQGTPEDVLMLTLVVLLSLVLGVACPRFTYHLVKEARDRPGRIYCYGISGILVGALLLISFVFLFAYTENFMKNLSYTMELIIVMPIFLITLGASILGMAAGFLVLGRLLLVWITGDEYGNFVSRLIATVLGIVAMIGLLFIPAVGQVLWIVTVLAGIGALIRQVELRWRARGA